MEIGGDLPVVVLAAVLGIVWTAAVLRSVQLVRRQRKLEARLQEHAAELLEERRRSAGQEQQLLRLDRMKTRFFTNMSHEFRTPLTLTMGPLEDVRSHPDLPEQVRQNVDLALTSSRRILRLINQLLDVARLESGQMHLSAARQDLVVFMAGLAHQYERLMQRRGIHFTVSLPETPVEVYYDSEKLEQVLVNLISNAVKHTAEGGAIQLSLDTDGREARLAVRDTGTGIAPEALPHIFDRFSEIGDTEDAEDGAGGVGLSVARDLVVLHGGTISVESAPRFGSTFTIALPLGRDHLSDDQVTEEASSPDFSRHILEIASLDPEAESLEDQEPDDRFTVLIADDSADIRAYLRGHLNGRYRVVEAADGQEALHLVRRSLPDLVISDLMMPVMDGLSLLADLRSDAETDFIPVIILTAKATEEDLVKAIKLGADAYVTKPFSLRELQARIDALITARLRLKARFEDSRKEPADSSEDLSGETDLDATFLSKLEEIVDENLSDENFDVQRLAESMRVSRATLHRRTKSILDTTPSEHLKYARLSRGATLLESGEWNVSEVAYAVGFRSVSYFSHSFRKAYGTTPSAYAERSSSRRKSGAET